MITHYIIPAATGKTRFALKEVETPNSMLIMKTQWLAREYPPARIWEGDLCRGRKIDKLIFDEYLGYIIDLTPRQLEKVAEQLRILKARGTEIILISTPHKKYSSAIWFLDSKGLMPEFNETSVPYTTRKEIVEMKDSFVLPSTCLIKQNPKWIRTFSPEIKEELRSNLGQIGYELQIEAKYLM